MVIRAPKASRCKHDNISSYGSNHQGKPTTTVPRLAKLLKLTHTIHYISLINCVNFL